MYVEKKLQANSEKVAFAKSFPGQLASWDAAVGKEVDRVMTLKGRPSCMVIFADRTFIVSSMAYLEPADLISLLLAARPLLDAHYKEAYQALDQCMVSDKEMQRMARLENILGAVKNNLPQIPELKEALKHLLEEET